MAEETDRIRDTLLANWDSGRDVARQAPHVVLDGPGRLRRRRAAVSQAGEQVTGWADAWRPYLPTLPTDPKQIVHLADRADDRPRLWTAFDSYARHHAQRAHPKHPELRDAADAARDAHGEAWRAVADTRRQRENELARFRSLARTPDPAERLSDADRDIGAARAELAAVRGRIARLTAEPTILAQPADRVAQERNTWRVHHAAEQARNRPAAPLPTAPKPGVVLPRPEDHEPPALRRAAGPGIGR